MIRNLLFAALCMAIAACGESASNNTPQQRAATACEAEAKARIGESAYQIDITALGQNAKLEDGSWKLQAPIVISPGLRNEAKQTLECTVRVAEGKPAEVTYINFIF
jgi:hypothetical protein